VNIYGILERKCLKIGIIINNINHSYKWFQGLAHINCEGLQYAVVFKGPLISLLNVWEYAITY
jgi:hypothetical protein